MIFQAACYRADAQKSAKFKIYLEQQPNFFLKETSVCLNSFYLSQQPRYAYSVYDRQSGELLSRFTTRNSKLYRFYLKQEPGQKEGWDKILLEDRTFRSKLKIYSILVIQIMYIFMSIQGKSEERNCRHRWRCQERYGGTSLCW